MKYDTKYLRMTQIWAENSYAERKKVGCLIVKNNRIISDGYNGTPKGFNNECEEVICDCNHYCLKEIGSNIAKVKSAKFCKNCNHATLKTKQHVLHAESNAITKLAKYGTSGIGATLYVTLSPCIECAKLIIQAGIKRVVYSEVYKNTDGIELLKQANIKVLNIKLN